MIRYFTLINVIGFLQKVPVANFNQVITNSEREWYSFREDQLVSFKTF